jgi:hypothetical protein
MRIIIMRIIRRRIVKIMRRRRRRIIRMKRGMRIRRQIEVKMMGIAGIMRIERVIRREKKLVIV